MSASRAILVTGGSRGIGRAVALLAGQRGWSVLVNYASDERAASNTVRDVEVAGGRALAVRGDVRLEHEVVALFDAAEQAFGKLTGVVNNAGIVAPSSKLADMDAARLERMFGINVLGAFLVARETARRLSRDRGGIGGSLVNVSSAASRLGSPHEFVDYAASKGAIDTMTLGLAKELGPAGVRVNAVRPGLIHTDIHASGGDAGRADRLGKTCPLGRAGMPDEVAQAIVWLLDDASSYVTGALLDVTGGR
jgi:NAD(P)-dependent dehydrogenase (short-subunit alcohol dehydrogenase family)